MRIIARVVFFNFFLSSLLHAQALKPAEWRSYTSMRSIKAMAIASDSIHLWAATDGGAFRINLRDPSEASLALRTTDGLTENDLTAVGSDNSGNTYLGGGNGAFDVYHSATQTIDKLGSDILNSSYPVKKINSIAVAGDSIVIGTAYGLEVYRPSRGYFATTVLQLGATQLRGDSVRQAIVVANVIYAAMRGGIAYAPKESDLPTPASWSFIRDSSGVVTALTQFNGSVFAGTSKGLWMVAVDRSRLQSTQFTSSIDRLVASRDTLYILDVSGNVFATHDLTNFIPEHLATVLGSVAAELFPSPFGGVAIGSASNGLAYTFQGIDHVGVYPPGPVGNNITGLNYSPTTDQLYTVNFTSGISLYQPQNDAWVTYGAGAGILPSATYDNILYDSIRNVTWLMTDGALYVMTGIGTSSASVTNIDAIQSGLPGSNYLNPNDGFVAPRGLPIIDRSGHFVLPTFAVNGMGISVLDQGMPYHFTNYKLLDAFAAWGCVTQDLEGNYWVGGYIKSIAPAESGVSWHDMSNNTYGNIAGGSGLPLASNAVNAVLTDQDDEIWCGTSNGLQIISNPYAITNPSPQFFIRTVDFLRFQLIHCMTTDGVGNKWIGTENGIFVVSPDGSDSIAHFSKENSPLLDNTINSIALDVARGEAYVGTPSGISRFSTLFKQGQPDYTQIRVFPNPIVQTSEESPEVYIDGLVAGSTVKIFTLNRKLVASINGTTLGSTVTWNGRDDLGRQVGSGEYLITATSPQATGNGTAKLIIVRK